MTKIRDVHTVLSADSHKFELSNSPRLPVDPWILKVTGNTEGMAMSKQIQGLLNDMDELISSCICSGMTDTPSYTLNTPSEELLSHKCKSATPVKVDRRLRDAMRTKLNEIGFAIEDQLITVFRTMYWSKQDDCHAVAISPRGSVPSWTSARQLSTGTLHERSCNVLTNEELTASTDLCHIGHRNKLKSNRISDNRNPSRSAASRIYPQNKSSSRIVSVERGSSQTSPPISISRNPSISDIDPVTEMRQVQTVADEMFVSVERYRPIAVAALLEAIALRLGADGVAFLMSTFSHTTNNDGKSARENDTAMSPFARGSSHSRILTDHQRSKEADVCLRVIALHPPVNLGVVEIPHSRGIAGSVYTSGIGVNVHRKTGADLIDTDSLGCKVMEAAKSCDVGTHRTTDQVENPLYHEKQSLVTAVLALPLRSYGTGRPLGVLQCWKRQSGDSALDSVQENVDMVNLAYSETANCFSALDEVILCRFAELLGVFLYSHGTECFRSCLPVCTTTTTVKPNRAIANARQCAENFLIPQDRRPEQLLSFNKIDEVEQCTSLAHLIAAHDEKILMYRGKEKIQEEPGYDKYSPVTTEEEMNTFQSAIHQISALETMWKESFAENKRLNLRCREHQEYIARLNYELKACKHLFQDLREQESWKSIQKVLAVDFDRYIRLQAQRFLQGVVTTTVSANNMREDTREIPSTHRSRNRLVGRTGTSPVKSLPKGSRNVTSAMQDELSHPIDPVKHCPPNVVHSQNPVRSGSSQQLRLHDSDHTNLTPLPPVDKSKKTKSTAFSARRTAVHATSRAKELHPFRISFQPCSTVET